MRFLLRNQRGGRFERKIWRKLRVNEQGCRWIIEVRLVRRVSTEDERDREWIKQLRANTRRHRRYLERFSIIFHFGGGVCGMPWMKSRPFTTARSRVFWWWSEYRIMFTLPLAAIQLRNCLHRKDEFAIYAENSCRSLLPGRHRKSSIVRTRECNEPGDRRCQSDESL